MTVMGSCQLVHTLLVPNPISPGRFWVGGEVGDAEFGELVESVGMVRAGGPGVRGDSAVDELGWWKLLQDLGDTLPGCA